MHKRSLGVVGASLLSMVASLPLTLAVATGTAHAARPTSAYVSLPSPTRLVDTRESGIIGAGGTINVRVTDGALPLAASTTAVVLNLTVVGPSGVGFWTAYAHGANRPLAASLYVDERASLIGAALAMPNLVTVPVGVDGTIDIFSQSGGHVVVDMLGAYVVSGATTSGRLQALPAPQRILDTRAFLPVQPGLPVTVPVPNANGASAAVLTVTTIATNPGYWTFYPTSVLTPPTAANLNSLFPLHVVANQVIVPLDTAGNFNVFAQSGGHLIVDLVAFITGSNAQQSTDGLFVPFDEPTRFLDTRAAGSNPLGGTQMALPGWNFEVPVTANPVVGRTDVAAVAMNVTVTDPLAAGYVTLGPAGASDTAVKTRPTATVSVVRSAQTLPSHAIVGLSPRGFEVFSLSGAHVVADVTGYYLGTPSAATFGVPANTDPSIAGCPGFADAPVGQIITGSSKAAVMRVQQRLLELGFWLFAVDGQYGLTTSQAVMAFQKWAGLPSTSAVDEATAVRLNSSLCRPTPGASAQGDLVEIDKGKQLLLIVRGGRTVWVLNTSTGNGLPFSEPDQNTPGVIQTGVSITRNGNHKVYFERPVGWWEGDLGQIYRPKYFVGGTAVHGSNSIPNYPASHGCVRVSVPAMDFVWAQNLMPQGSRVWVHD